MDKTKIAARLGIIALCAMLAACGGGTVDNTAGSNASFGTDNTSGTTSPSTSLPQNSAPTPDTITTVAANQPTTLRWAAPMTDELGNSVSLWQVKGYRVYQGTSTTDLKLVSDINDRNTLEYSLAGLSAGTYYLAVTAYDNDGIESDYSGIAQLTIQ